MTDTRERLAAVQAIPAGPTTLADVAAGIGRDSELIEATRAVRKCSACCCAHFPAKRSR